MPSYETITYESADGVGTLTLNRPDRLNGITNKMMLELYDVVSKLSASSMARYIAGAYFSIQERREGPKLKLILA